LEKRRKIFGSPEENPRPWRFLMVGKSVKKPWDGDRAREGNTGRGFSKKPKTRISVTSCPRSKLQWLRGRPAGRKRCQRGAGGIEEEETRQSRQKLQANRTHSKAEKGKFWTEGKTFEGKKKVGDWKEEGKKRIGRRIVFTATGTHLTCDWGTPCSGKVNT